MRASFRLIKVGTLQRKAIFFGILIKAFVYKRDKWPMSECLQMDSERKQERTLQLAKLTLNNFEERVKDGDEDFDRSRFLA